MQAHKICPVRPRVLGFATGVHYFVLRQHELNDNLIGSYIYIGDEEFLVKYKRQIETCHICNKPGHKGADCNEKFDKQWPKLSESTIGGVEDTRLEAKAKDTKEIRGQGQGQPFRGQTLSRSRTGMLEAKAKEQGHRRKRSQKKGLQKKIFRRSPIH